MPMLGFGVLAAGLGLTAASLLTRIPVRCCMVTLIGVEGGKKMKTSIGVYYQDEYVRENNRWLIAKRRSVFDWQDKRELGQ